MKKHDLAMIAGGMEVPKTTKPDLPDNLSKNLFDSLQGIIYLNDSQICEMNNVAKVYGNTPRIEVELYEL